MEIKFNVSDVIVLTREQGMDKVIINTYDLPSTVYPWDEKGSLTMDVAKGQGADYVKKTFGIEPQVIKC